MTQTALDPVWVIPIYIVFAVANAGIAFFAARRILKLQATFLRCLLACTLWAIMAGLFVLLLKSMGMTRPIQELAGFALIPVQAWMMGTFINGADGKPIGIKSGLLLVLLTFIGWALIPVVLVILLVLYVIIKILTDGIYFGASG